MRRETMTNHINTNNSTITQDMLDETQEIEILTGEGEEGTREDYEGARTVRAVRARLTSERCGGDRWAILILDGERV